MADDSHRSAATDDSYLDELLDDQVAPYEILGTPFNASTVSRTDPDARTAIRLALLDQSRADVFDALDERSYDRLEALAQRLTLERVVPFVGAGLSVPLNFPAWGKFLISCARGKLPEETVQKYLDTDDYVGLTDALLESPGGARYMDERLSVFDRRVPIGGVHRLLPALFKRLVYTTNFDRSLEEAYRNHDIRPVLGTDSSWDGPSASYQRGDNVLFKIHGDCMVPTSRILTGCEYDKAYSADSALRRDLMELFTDFAVIFIGCSLVSDRTLDVALAAAENTDRGKAVNHLAFLPLPDHSDDQNRREDFLAERRIFPIWYPNDAGDHALLGRMLWLLAAER